MEKKSDYKYVPATGTRGSQSSGVNIQMHVGSGATVFAPYLSHVQAKDITFSQNNASARHSGGEIDITSVIAEYKKSLVAEHACIREYTSCPGEHVQLADRYVDPLIIQRHRKKKEKEKEIRYRGEDFHHARTYHTDRHITVDKLFSQEDSPNGVPPKAVILQGNSGSGKSFTAQKILYDWANGNLFAGIFDMVFHLKCSDLNDNAGDVNLVELLNCSEEMAQIFKKIPERVLFLVDGFDELRLSLPKKPLPVKADIKAEPGAVLSSLLKGFILKESFLLVTTRSIAAEKLGKLLKFPQRFTEIMGFSENGIQEYFQKFFESDERSRQVYEEVKANGTLYTACSSPVMCWLICSVFKEKSKMSKKMTQGFRSTTSVLVDFVFILLEHHCQGLTQSQQRDLLKDLGQLAHKGILKGRVLFQRNQVPETILNVLDSTSIPFLCTFHYKDRINVKEMFSFMHLSFQEFFAALWYTFLDETEAKTEIEKLLSFSSVDSYHVLPIIQCLFGLSNQAVNNLLMKKHQQAVSHATCDQLQEWLYKFVSQYLNAHLCSFALQCLYEGNNNHVVQNAMKIWEAAVPGIRIQLSSSNTTEYHAAAYCLQFCRRIRTLDLQGSTMKNLIMLEKTLSKCDEMHLSVSHVSDNDVDALISVVGKGKHLQQLRVEGGDLSDQSVRRIMSALHKRRSVYTVHLSVKNISCTNAEIVMNTFRSNVVSQKLSLSVGTKCRNSEENLCSHLELSHEHTFARISVEHKKLDSYDVHIDAGKPGQTFKFICFSADCSDISIMSACDWRNFLQISSNLRKIENPEFHENVDALVSFFHSIHDLREVRLHAINLSQKCAAKILSLYHARPLQDSYNYRWLKVDSLKGMDEEDICSLSFDHQNIGYMGNFFRLSLKEQACSSSPHTTWAAESTPALKEISLRFPVLKRGYVDWKVLLGRLCQMLKSQERDQPLSFLLSLPDLMAVMFDSRTLHENWAARVLAFIQACTSLQYLEVEVEKPCENLGLVRGDAVGDGAFHGHTVLFLGCRHLNYPYDDRITDDLEIDIVSALGQHNQVPCITLIMTNDTENYNIDWRQFLIFYHQLKGLTEHCLEYDQSLDALMSVVNSIPGLKEMHLALRFLTVDGAVSIVQLMQTCPSLCTIDVLVPTQPMSYFLNSCFPKVMEMNSISTDDSDSSSMTDSDGDGDGDRGRLSWPSFTSVAEEIGHYELDLCSELIMRKNSRNEFKLSLRCNSSDPLTKAALSYISLILTEYTAESKIDWRSFFQSYYDTKGLNETFTDYDGKVNNILYFLYYVPGLKKVELGTHTLIESWASCVLHLSYVNDGIDNICVLLEEDNTDSGCSSFTVKRNHTDSTVSVKIQRANYTETTPSLISFTVPHSEILNINGPDLLHRMRCLRFLNDNRSLEYDVGINELMSSLHAIPRLQKLKLEIGNVTQSWATRIISFSTCPSLKKICVTTLHGHMIMEDAILKIKKKWRRRDCVVVLKGLRCSNSTDRCTEENWTPHTYLECNDMVKLSLCGGFCSQLDGFYKTDSESEADTHDYKFDLNEAEQQPDAQEPEWAEEEFTEDHDIFEF